nr:methyl-accepting chemotaxis protein [Desulfobulbaceae bacterium]
MSDKTRYVRRQYFIKKGFQANFILKFCLLVMVGSGLSIGLIFFLSRETLTSSYNNSRLIIESTASAMLPAVLLSNLIVFGLVSVGVIIVTLFISHKIAGPLYRLEQGLKAVIAGDIGHQIQFRKKDQVGILADTFNEMTAGLYQKAVLVQNEVTALHEKAVSLDASDELLAGIRRIQEEIAEQLGA